MAENQKPNAEEAGETMAGCPVKMDNGLPCGRLIHHAPTGVDETPVCLMHSRDPNKSDEEFQKEFESILEKAGDGVADFTRFVFPNADYSGREFKAVCIFQHATFTQNAVFRGATFTRRADFSWASFTQDAVFFGARFTQDADFLGAIFTQAAVFIRATFTQDVYFDGATFAQYAHFESATFTQDANFAVATFTQDADFFGATFTQHADFSSATFKLRALFRFARFLGRVDFRETRFRGDPEMPSANDLEHPTEELARKRDSCLLPGSVLTGAYFERAEDVYFYKTYLGLALFHNCDVSEFKFSDVTWLERPGSRKRMAFDEIVDSKCPDASALRPKEDTADSRNYRLIAELYQQLKKNYDDRRDYWTAGDFHYGEMEMKRLATPPAGRILRWLTEHKKERAAPRAWKLKQGWHQRMGFAAWYKRWSEYGENYTRPLGWLAFVVLLFGLAAYPCVGLRYSGPNPASAASTSRQATTGQEPPPLRWWSPCPDAGSYHTCMGLWRVGGNSLVASFEVAAFQRQLAFRPAYAWGRFLRLLELLLTSTFIALFLLALRRQFRR